MNTNSYMTWALFGAAGGAGFGLFAVPLIYILVNLFAEGVTLGETVRFALANGATWAVLGLFSGIFCYVVYRIQTASKEE